VNDVECIQMVQGNNKRQFERIDEQIAIDYRIITLGDKPHENLRFSGLADMDNVSEGGILFEYHESIPVGSLMELGFNIGTDVPIHLKGRVKHVKQLGVSRFAIGIQFLASMKEDIEALINFINEKSLLRKQKRKESEQNT